MSSRESASWVPKHISSESIRYTIVTMILNCKTYIKCSQIHKIIQSNNNKISKGKHNSSQDREGKTPYDPTISTKPAIHQDRDISRTQERERDQTHSYWHKPSAPRVDYSLLIMVATGMMKMATRCRFMSGTSTQKGNSFWKLEFHYCRMLLMRHYDQRPFDKTVCDAIIANGGVKNHQKGAKRLRWRMHQTRFRF